MRTVTVTFYILACVLLTHSCTDNTYEKEVLNYRQLRTEMFQDPRQSPLPKKEVSSFAGLQFFDVSPVYKVRAKLKKSSFTKYTNLFGDQDVKQIHKEIGTLYFKIQEKEYQLTSFRSNSQPQHLLFIPFKDRTSGKQTYGGGRYVEAKMETDSSWTLDFNFAYHPFCVFNEKYTCAACPKENVLDISVEAGEKLPLHYK